MKSEKQEIRIIRDIDLFESMYEQGFVSKEEYDSWRLLDLKCVKEGLKDE